MEKTQGTKESTIRAALYIRVSTKKQAERGFSLEDQQRDLRQHCARLGWEIVDTFIDKGESARTGDRPEFQRLLSLCKKRQIDFVVVAALNRFARDMGVQAKAIADLRRCKTRVRSLAEPNIDETAAGKLAGNIIGAFNQYFSDALSERMQQAERSSRAAGRCPRNAPLGYKNVKALAGEPNIAPDESAVHITRAFELMATGKFTVADVLRIVTSEGLTTKRNKPVPMQTFSKVLKNPVYIGKQRSRKYDEVTQGLWRPIVDEPTFNKVQAIFSGKTPTTVPHVRRRPDFPLRVTLLCEGCGRPLTGGNARGRSGKRFSYYWCRTAGCRKVKSIRVQDIDDQFKKLLERLKANPEFVAKFLPKYEAALRASEEPVKAEIRALEAEIDQKDAQRMKLDRKRHIEESIDEAIYREMRDALVDEIEGLEERLTYISMPQTIREMQWVFSKNLLLDVSTAWERGSVDQRQMFQKVLFPKGIKVSSQGKIFEPDTDCLFSHLENLTSDFINLASPTGFEPVLPP